MAVDTVQEIKNKLSITDIVSPYVKLTRAGKSMVGLCPFHKEKTPSFHVSPERGSWHCFGCGEGGDGFSFIEKVEGVDFKGALKILAEKAGVPTTTIYGSGSREHEEKRERLRDAMARASAWYATQLPGSPAEAYALKRGLSKESIKEWGLGYAPEAWRALLEALTAEGFTVPELLAAGLVKEADGKPGTYYDRFRNRLMFPIRDTAGRVVAFTGRTLAADEQAGHHTNSATGGSVGVVAKYLNSPETELFYKSEVLFGMDRAKDAIRVRRFAMLVEGQLDVLLSHQAGFTNAIALSGTALSEKHLSLMKRYSENLMLVLDADPAGLKATARSAELALRHGLRVKAAELPKGKDPADLVNEDAAEFTRRVKDARPVVDFFLAQLSGEHADPHRLLRAAEAIVLPLLAAVPSAMERDHFIQATARTLNLSSEAVRESLKSVARVQEMVSRNEPVPVRSAPVERRKLSDSRGEQVLAILHVYPGTPLAERVKSGYCRVTEAAELPSEVPPEPVLFQTEKMLGTEPAESAADELLLAFEEAVIREAYQEAVTNLRRAETIGDSAAIEREQAVCAKLSSRLAALGK